MRYRGNSVTGVLFVLGVLMLVTCGGADTIGEPWGGFDAARERIETYRMGDLTVRVIDADSTAVPDASVIVSMRRHAFSFGSVIDPKLSFTRTGPRPEWGRYHAMIDSLFNLVVFNNAMKWQSRVTADGSPDREVRDAADACVRWLRSRGIPLKGHAVIWPGYEYSPDYLREAPPEQLRSALYDWIDEIMSRYRGQLTSWDVVNEPVQVRTFIDMFGNEEVVRWFEHAREIEPDCRLYVNEDGMFSGRNIDDYLWWLSYLLEHDAPVDGIGIQAHVTTGDLIGEQNLERCWAALERFAAFGLPISISEFDCEGTSGEDRQAECLRNALYLAFSHPAVEEFILWGFWDGRHWRNTPTFGMDEAGLWREDWTIKQAGQTWIDLLFGEWWTEETGVTDTAGRFALRGFCGEYEVTVSDGDHTRTVPVTLTRDGAVVDVRLTD